MEKLCLFCKYFYLDTGWAGTDVTPGDGLEMYCDHGHWKLDRFYEGAEWYRSRMAMAWTCDDYEECEQVKRWRDRDSAERREHG